MLTQRERWLMQQAYEAGQLDNDLWHLIDKPDSAQPCFEAWLAELTHMDEEGYETGTIEQFLDEEAPE